MMINNKTCTLVALLVGSSIVNTAFASGNESSPRMRNAMDYLVGGGYIGNPPSQISTVPILELGVGWDLNMECGKFDPKITVSNQLNGLTEGFRNMMSNIIDSATGAVAGLPALAIQRANPGLYDMLQQGILQGKMDFEWAESSCEEMSRVMFGEESFPFENYKLQIKTNNWSEEISAAGGDAVRAKNELDDTNHGNEGAEWTCSNKKGGTGQQPIRAITDVVQVGYNIIFDRVDTCSTGAVAAAVGGGTPLWEYWASPVAASNWAKNVLGDIDIRTCDGCKKMSGTPGKGLMYRHDDMRNDIADDLTDLVTGAMLMSWQNLNRVSAPPGVVIDDVIIMSIRKQPANSRQSMIYKLSGEIAYIRLVEQGRLLTQLLQTGVKEPNVASFEPAKTIVADAVDELQIQLDQLEREINTRKDVAENTIHRILGREEKRVQETRTPLRSKPSTIDQLGKPD